MKALITGAAGFIGSNLARIILDQGEQIRAIDNFNDYYDRRFKDANIAPWRDAPEVEFIEDDVNRVDLAELLDGIEVIYHLSAQAGVRASWGENFAVYTDANIMATQRLLEAALAKSRAGGKIKFVFASSSSVYGDTTDLPMREDSVLNPVSPYGVTKLASEQMCRLYHRNFGLPTVSLRFFTVYGPGQRPDMAFHRFLKAIAAGEEMRVFGDGSQSRDFTYVSDICAGMIAARKGTDGGVYNLGGGRRMALKEVIDLMTEIIGRPAKIKYLPVADGDVRHTSADMSKAERELNFKPEFNIADGLARELDWLRGVYEL